MDLAYVLKRTEPKAGSGYPADLDTTIGQAVLRKVVQRLGGIHTAAVALAVSPSDITRYIDGTLLAPDDVFLRAIDLVPDDLPVILSGSSEPFNRSPA